MSNYTTISFRYQLFCRKKYIFGIVIPLDGNLTSKSLTGWRKQVLDILKVCGQNIRRYRKDKNLTLKQLSHSLSITGSYLGYLERGQRNSSLLTLAKIAEVLGVPPETFLRAPEDEFARALYELHDLLINLNDVKHVTFLKEVLESYLKLKDAQA